MPTATPTTTHARHQAGDLIFVRPAPDDAIGRLVAEATHGPFCHVRVRISAEQVVEALPSGITRAYVQIEPDAADCAALGANLPTARVTAMVTWLIQQDANRDVYGWWDIAADFVQALIPATLGSRTPFLVRPHAFDCSHLAAVAIVSAGYPLAPDLIADLPRISPNGLARALGVIK